MIPRRTMLKTVAAASAAVWLPPRASAAEVTPVSSESILAYLEGLARDDGGYGWEGQGHSHLTPTFFVIGCYRLLKKPLPRSAALAEFVRTHHPAALKKLEQERRIFEWQQAQALAWLGADAGFLKERIAAWKQPLAYMKQYEQHGYPLFSSEMGVILARVLLGMSAEELPKEFVAYLDRHRRANGSFANTPAEDGSDGHVLSTWWGLQALQTLNRSREQRDECVAWLKACQLPGGGFTFQPKPEFGGADDVAYTWAAVRGLRHLDAEPERREAAISYLHSLANADGGFSDRPGWRSNPMATYYALDALDALRALDSLAGIKRRPAPGKRVLPENLKVFTIQLEAHGQGSPSEAVALARALRIHWWGAKNAKPEWLARAQALADQQKVAVKFFVANEEYGTWVHVPGQGTYSHTSDIFAPAGAEIGSSLAKQGVVSWEQFRRERLGPLERGQGRLLWQFGENEELVRMYLDDSVERGGYAAISTYHFGNPDFTNSEPFLHRWRGQIPYVALQDSHGPEPWWFADMTTGFRTVFLATEPTWEGWLKALKQNWVVAIRRDAWTAGKTWMHSGSLEVLEYVQSREQEWRWWDHPEIRRPLVSLVAVRPGDEFEAGKPEQGVTIRVRCAWENSPQGLLKQPLAQFVRLTVDGEEVTPTLQAKKRPNGLYDEYYHAFHIPEPKAGVHRVKAVVQELATKGEVSEAIEFTV